MTFFTKKSSFPGFFLLLLLCAGLALGGCARNTGSGQDIHSMPPEEADDSSTVEETGTAAGVPTSETASSDSKKNAGTPSKKKKRTGADSGNSARDEDGHFSAKGKGLLVVLDPGHSQQVPGTMEPIGPGSSEMKDADTVGTYGPSSGLHEYELTMQVCQKLRAELEKRGYKVKFTHVDTYLPISCVERATVANENNADVFLRVHANGAENTSANGAMTICITENNPYHPELYKASARLSMVLLNTFCEKTGAKKEYVWETDTMTGNNWAEVPTSLIELGYMTNPDEDLRMAQDSYQKKMASAIADGLDKWFEEMPEEERKTHPALAGLDWDSTASSETGGTAAGADEADSGNTQQDEDRRGEDGDMSGSEDAQQDEDRRDGDSSEDAQQDEDRDDSSSGEDTSGTGSGSEETETGEEVLLDEE
ncbi:MAG: N-acetylmuramoyl-L-alanine amidase [Eubacteriales bacterium]|nr:N-acetylmuramoyl-L-alanine amidase [Eubacteriales bacterium]